MQQPGSTFVMTACFRDTLILSDISICWASLKPHLLWYLFEVSSVVTFFWCISNLFFNCQKFTEFVRPNRRGGGQQIFQPCFISSHITLKSLLTDDGLLSRAGGFPQRTQMKQHTLEGCHRSSSFYGSVWHAPLANSEHSTASSQPSASLSWCLDLPVWPLPPHPPTHRLTGNPVVFT